MNRTQLYFPKRQLDVLRQEARRRSITVSELVREAVREKFEPRPKSTTVRHETFVEASRRIGRLGTKGPKDLSSQMDAYLYGGK